MKEIIEVMNHQRHDWLNHIQVLLGYLKLERYEMCEEYIRKITADANRDTLVFRLEYPPLVAYLLSFNALHNNVRIEVEIPAPFSLMMLEEGPRLGDFILSVVKLYQQHALYNDGQSNTLLLTLHCEEGALQVVADFAGELDVGKSTSALDKMQIQAQAWGANVLLAPHTASESVLECLFPLS
ncbi:Spo0B domain-containing protein [Aneurinibacillus aneurinilyticus]|uniref:Spo0B domain-containing protein n=1 Tax=Aneurinibacillus aneurinilyticus TaxID=1391 RepID=UPI002E1BD134|nr:Spo0B domain-containing protein [Aneurinibacillus aneurinilyticus]